MAEQPIANNNMYCIKCRSHTENVDLRHEKITSKGQPRSVMKATCAVCSKRKNRFDKTAKAEGEPTVGTDPVENKVKKQRETKVSKKLIENLLLKFIESVSLKSES